MGRKVETRILLDMVLALMFLIAIPSVAFRAGTAQADSSSGYRECYFGDGATVESVREILTDSDGQTPTVVVTGPDGTARTSGPIQEGDLVEIFDAQKKLINRFLNVRPSVDSSAEPSSSETSGQPASSGGGVSSEEGPESDPSGADASPENSSVPDYSSGNGYYLFDGPVTVAGLEEQILEEGTQGSALTIASASGAVRESGPVCTGDVLTVRNGDGSLQSRVTAVIPGDLTRCGSATEEGCRALYDYLTDRAALRGDVLRAADLNGDGEVTTSDLLELKKMLDEAD